jgi:hypothetical protein
MIFIPEDLASLLADAASIAVIVRTKDGQEHQFDGAWLKQDLPPTVTAPLAMPGVFRSDTREQ